MHRKTAFIANNQIEEVKVADSDVPAHYKKSAPKAAVKKPVKKKKPAKAKR